MRASLLLLSALVALATASAAQTLPTAEFSEVQPELIGGIEGLQAGIAYPDFERRAGVEGRVTVRFVVGTDGVPSAVEVVRAVSPGLDAAAVRAVQRARFTPGRENGQPVAVRFTLPIMFRIQDGIAGETTGGAGGAPALSYDALPEAAPAQSAEDQAAYEALPDSTRARLDAAVAAYAVATPWSRVPPAVFPSCLAAADTVTASAERLGAASAAASAGVPLPTLGAFALAPGASVYTQPALGRMEVGRTVGQGIVTAERFVVRDDGTLVVEAMYAGGGSRYRVYVDPAEAGFPTATAERQEAERLLEAATERARVQLSAARRDADACAVGATAEWRRRNAAAAGMFYTETLTTARLTDELGGYTETVAVRAGSPLFVRLFAGDSFWVTTADGTRSGWTGSGALRDAAGARAFLQPQMDELDRAAAQREREQMAASPPLLISEFRAVGGDYASGYRIGVSNMRPGKTVNYLRMTVQPYNRVGDVLTARQGGGRQTGTGIGPMEASATEVYTVEMESVWFTDLVDCVRLVSLRAEYADGSARTWSGRDLDLLFGEGGRWDTCSRP